MRYRNTHVTTSIPRGRHALHGAGSQEYHTHTASRFTGTPHAHREPVHRNTTRTPRAGSQEHHTHREPVHRNTTRTPRAGSQERHTHHEPVHGVPALVRGPPDELRYRVVLVVQHRRLKRKGGQVSRSEREREGPIIKKRNDLDEAKYSHCSLKTRAAKSHRDREWE